MRNFPYVKSLEHDGYNINRGGDISTTTSIYQVQLPRIFLPDLYTFQTGMLMLSPWVMVNPGTVESSYNEHSYNEILSKEFSPVIFNLIKYRYNESS